MKGKERAKQKLYAGGYLTVFLALTITVLLSLILVLVEGARINAVRMKTETAGNIAVRSVLGEFHRELLRQYDLYFIDTSYGTGTGSVENLRQHLQTYMEKNLIAEPAPGFGLKGDFTGTSLAGLTLDAARFAADDRAQALREQVFAYMTAAPGGEVLAEILPDTSVWQGMLEDGAVWEEKRKEAGEDLREGIREAKEKAKKEHTAQERREAREEGDETAQEAVEAMDQFRLLPILRQIFGDTSGISQAVAGTNLLSGRGIHYGDGLRPDNSHGYPRADEAVFDLYLGEKCGCYTRPLEKGRLKYQLEYILCGRETDMENLEKTAERLFLIRMASNCASIFSDTARGAQAQAVAVLVSLVLFSPQLAELFKNVLLFSWAYLESIRDLRTLFDGGRVPLQKTPETWRTSFLGLLAPEDAVAGSGAGTGLLYTDYLQGLLFLEGSSVKSIRTMDIMEMDIRMTEGNSGFCMDWCADAFSMTASVTSRFGYSFELVKSEGYN
ncbi:MAG: hypothetical protein E7238_03790 [Sarcina sp.]|nr:hypothetical protein [Sarcina sp.]